MKQEGNHVTRPASTVSVNIITLLSLYCQIISQKSLIVFLSGPDNNRQ